MSKKFVVNCLTVYGLGKRKFSSGDEVSEEDFPPGNALKMVQSGHLRLAEGETLTKEEANPRETQDVDLGTPATVNTEETKEEEKVSAPKKKAQKDISEDEIKQYLLEKEIEFNPALKKKDLYKLYVEN